MNLAAGPASCAQACGTGLNLQVMPTSAARRPIKAVAASTDEDGALGHENSASSLSLCQVRVVLGAASLPCPPAQAQPRQGP